MMLAEETLHDLPDSFWKNFCIALIVLLGVAAVVVLIWSAMRKPAPLKLSDDPAIEVRKAPKRFNHDLAETRHTELDRRVTRLENWRDGLIQKLEDDKQEILRAGDDRQKFLEEKQEERHALNVRRINRLLEAVSRLCGRQNIPMPSEGEEI
jgi:hypothetical protein